LPIPTFESLNAWEKADYLALEFYVNNSTPEQRLQWLEDAHDFALQVAYERHSRGLVTIDDEGNIWPRSLQPAVNDSLASPGHSSLDINPARRQGVI
jgi:hypothetical protein